MAANFYNNSGMMAGYDFHKYWEFLPPPPPGLLLLSYVHVVAAAFVQFPATDWKRTHSVRSNGLEMIQGGFDLYLVPHVPFPLPGGWGEVATLIEVFLMSGSKAQLTAHSVTGKGEPLATCIIGAMGANLNCQEFGLSAPTGIVSNINSVETSPTLGDYVGAIVGWAVDAAIGFAMNKYLPNSTIREKVASAFVTHYWRRVGDIPRDKVYDVPSHTQEFVQTWIDSDFGKAVDGLQERVKKAYTGK